ncbi:MAG: bifunctional aspartate kinase/homoserine dehydrogenase I [Psychrobium sp.]|nr:bifunctional aspartate kinase/homoserine dehydrogenase I [Psychrobium sp.]
MRVMKFGGSSLADVERVERVANILLDSSKEDQLAVVLSAPGKTTNNIVEAVDLNCQGLSDDDALSRVANTFNDIVEALAAKYPDYDKRVVEAVWQKQSAMLKRSLSGVKLLSQCPDNIRAQLIVVGERLSIAIMAQLLKVKGIDVGLLEPTDFMHADSNYLEAQVDIEKARAAMSEKDLSSARVWLMPGFTAVNEDGEIVTLGRNGSDYSAACLAASLHADRCEIWTDVDGVYNADPRLVKDAQLIKQLSYQEAMELSYFGAKVLHPKTIAPIAQYHIPCLIKNSFNPSAPGSLVSAERQDDENQVKAISNLDDISMISISGPGMKGMVGMASRIFEAISLAGVSVSLITQSSSEYSISFCVASQDHLVVKKALDAEFELELRSDLLEPFEIRHQLAIISLIGDRMKTVQGVAAKFFQALSQARVNVVAIAQGSSERSISTVIDQHRCPRAIKACHQRFFNSLQYIDLFLIGCGNVGTELLAQVHNQREYLAKKNIVIRVCGLANSKKMLLTTEGIDTTNWQQKLQLSEQAYDVDQLMYFAKDNHLLNPLVVDCTSSQTIADQYVQLLEAGFHVVTPNKKANTASQEYYQQLRKAALVKRRRFLYETTVGAGLPVIDNLQNLLSAGDELESFSGILSGSLSYIFGQLDEGMTLSEATEIAKEKCFTEPDPRDDLSGMDVARKVLILARESGMSLELSDVEVQSVLPSDFDSSGTVSEFMSNLPKADAHIAKQVNDAKAQGQLLRYVGIIEGEGEQRVCKVQIRAVDASDPLYSVKGGENALAFYSRYYQPLPFVLRGYGAGNAVTAAGIFADMLRTLAWQREV